MEPKVNYTLVGLFVALLGTALLAGVLWLSRTDYRGVYDRYYTYMTESVSGLSADSAVKYRGVDVGRVKEIVLNPKNPEEVRIALDLVRGTPVKSDTVAVLETQGLTGISTINLTGGSRDAPLLGVKPGEQFPVIPTRPSFFSRLDHALSRVLDDQSLPRLLENLTALAQDARGVVDAQSRADLKRILADLAKVTTALASRRAELGAGIANADVALERFADLSIKLDAQLPELMDQAKSSVRSLHQMTEEIARASTALRSTVDENRSEIGQFTGQTLAETGALVADLRQLTATLQRLAQELEREPNALIFGRSRPARGPGE